MAIRERVVGYVERGYSHRAAAARFRVSARFVNDMVILKRQTGRLDTRSQGNGGGHGTLGWLRSWIADWMAAKRDLTLDDLVAEAMHAVGAWSLFLPPYSPDLNPIKMAFAKLKALIRRAAARTYDELSRTVGHVCDLFTDEACYNFFKAAGYETN